MPTYEYACRDCGEHLEVVQSFKDDALTVCPNCEGQLRKVFSAAGIIFKGSGWHIKDYASKSGASTTGAGGGDGGSSSESSSSDSDGKTTTKKKDTPAKKQDGSSSGSGASSSSGSKASSTPTEKSA